MDSLTQFVLGSTLSVLCLGKTLGPRNAALLGGLLGTTPDLDVFLSFDTPVDAFVMHRGWTHALATHAVAAPIIGELIARNVRPLKDHRALVWLTVFLCFSTHAIIDALTVYGTRLFWPFYRDPVGVGSIFIIDPLYTVPLLGVTVWALARRHWSRPIGRGVTVALIFSTIYLGLGVMLQAQAENRAKAIFAKAGILTDSVFAIAAPFNIVLWKVIGLEEDRYHNVYLSMFGDDQQTRIYTHPRHPELKPCLAQNDSFEKLAWFSRGYYRVELEDDRLVVSDLRMGLTPNYVFRFAIAERTGNTFSEIQPVLSVTEPRIAEGDLDWLWQRVLGHPSTRAAEATDLNPADSSAPSVC
jgi:inner membrane protein